LPKAIGRLPVYRRLPIRGIEYEYFGLLDDRRPYTHIVWLAFAERVRHCNQPFLPYSQYVPAIVLQSVGVPDLLASGFGTLEENYPHRHSKEFQFQ
jgi:hypothetical protein